MSAIETEPGDVFRHTLLAVVHARAGHAYTALRQVTELEASALRDDPDSPHHRRDHRGSR